jgi:hypothetical protein
MRSRLAATVMLSVGVFIVMALVVSLGVLWLSGGLLSGVLIGGICGAAAAFTISIVSTASGRSGERSGNEHERSGGRGDS